LSKFLSAVLTTNLTVLEIMRRQGCLLSLRTWLWFFGFITIQAMPRQRLLRQPLSLNHDVVTTAVLWIDEVLPETDHDSGSVRAHALVHEIMSQSAHVTILPTSQYPRPISYLSAIALEGAKVIAKIDEAKGTYVGLRYEDMARRSWRTPGQNIECLFSHIVISRRGSYRATIDDSGDVHRSLVLERCKAAQIIFDTVDLHFLRNARKKALAGETLDLMSLATEEITMSLSSTSTWVVSMLERNILSAVLARFIDSNPNHRRDASTVPQIEIVSNVVRESQQLSAFNFEGRENFVFIGSLNHAPNVDALHWLLLDIWPTFLQLEMDSELHDSTSPPSLLLVGSDWNGNHSITNKIFGERKFSKMTNPRTRVKILGHVADLHALMARSRVSLAPLRFGAGVKGKVCLSAEMGVPLVASKIAMEGTNIPAAVAQTTAKFAEAMLHLYYNKAEWEKQRGAALEEVRRSYGRERVQRVLSGLFRSVST